MSEKLLDRLNEERTVVLPPGEPADQIERILDRPDADAYIAAIDPPVLHHLIKTAGWAEATDLIPFVTTYQIQVCVDLDCWSKESFDTEALSPWLAALITTTTDAQFASTCRELDPEILAMFFKENLKVGEMSDEGEVPEAFYHMEVETSPDGVYGLVYPDDDATADLLRNIIKHLYHSDRVLAWTLLEACRWELMSPMEHEALRWRNSRLEEYGYVSRDEAFQIYHVLPPLWLRKSLEDGSYDPKIETRIRPDNLPIVPSLDEENEFFFFRAMEKVDDAEIRSRLTVEFVTLQNRAAIAEGINPGDAQSASTTVRRTAGYLSLGLSFISRDDLLKAAKMLEAVKLIDVFRAGFTAVSTISKNAAKLRYRPSLTLIDGEHYSLLKQSNALLLTHLNHARPEYFENEKLDVFREQSQLDGAALRVASIALKQIVVFNAFELSPQKLSKIAYDKNNISTPDVVTFDFILRTALAQSLTKGSDFFAPLSSSQIKSLPSIIRSKPWGQDPVGFFESINGAIVTIVPAAMIRLVGSWFQQCLESLEDEFSEIVSVDDAKVFATVVLV